jgi:hypothetical protein
MFCCLIVVMCDESKPQVELKLKVVKTVDLMPIIDQPDYDSDYDSNRRRKKTVLGCKKGGAYKPTTIRKNLKRSERENVNVYLGFVVIFMHRGNDILQLCLAYTIISWTKS